jgi:hypothetical protein
LSPTARFSYLRIKGHTIPVSYIKEKVFMLQFYFLSVLCTLVGSLALVVSDLSNKLTSLVPVREILTGKGMQITLGFASLIVGVIKFFVRAPWDSVAVVGDLLPALVGIGVGLALLADFFREKAGESNAVVEKASTLTKVYHIPLGIVGLITAILHFLFPSTVIL